MFKMNKDVQVSFENTLLEKMELQGVLISPINPSVGVSASFEKVGNTYVLRLYGLLREQKSNTYHVTHEIEAFSFQSRRELKGFLEKLPSMSGLEMLLLLNPTPKLYSVN